MPALDLDSVRARLATRSPRLVTGPSARAAVAAILRPSVEGPEVLLIRRAERAGDPWSGHMAFPGGRASGDEREPLDTAIRETREEVGLDLRRHAALLGRLDDLPAISRGKPVGLIISPFVFGLAAEGVLVPNDEVAATAWAPLERLASSASATTIDYSWEGSTLTLPGLRVGSDVVWGLTFQMLRTLFDVLGLG